MKTRTTVVITVLTHLAQRALCLFSDHTEKLSSYSDRATPLDNSLTLKSCTLTRSGAGSFTSSVSFMGPRHITAKIPGFVIFIASGKDRQSDKTSL